MPPHPSAVIHASAAPNLAPLALSASLAAPQFSAASGGAPLASAHSALSPSYLRVPRLAPQSSAFPSFAGWSSDSTGPPADTHSSAGPRVSFAAPEPRLLWVSAWTSAGSSSELECSAVRLAAIPYRVSLGFLSIDAGMYVLAAALHRRSPPLSAVLPSEGECCAVTDAPLPRRPRLCPSWRRLRPPPRCYYDRSLCFFWLIVLCVSQPKMSRGVVLYGLRK